MKGQENKKEDNPVQSQSKRYLKSILVKDNEIRFVDVDKIHWIEANGNYVKLHCNPQTHIVRGSLKKMEKKLNPKEFIRIHKSSIINVTKVNFIQTRKTGDLIAKMNCGKTLSISRNYKENLEKFKI